MRRTRLMDIGGFGLTLAIVGVALCANDKQGEDFQSPAARNAKAQFAARLAEIEKDAEAKRATARKAYVAELEKAKNDSTRRADLDEAVRIRDELNAVQTAETSRAKPEWRGREALASRVAGTSWTLPGNQLTLKEDGTLIRPDNTRGIWAPVGKLAIVLTYEDGWTDLWQFDDRLTVAKVTHARLGELFEAKRSP